MIRFERVKIAFVLSLAAGLIYALTSQLINRVVMGDVPIYSAVPSPVLSIIGLTLLIAVWGAITSIPQKIVNKLILGGLTGAFGASIVQLMVREGRLGFYDGLAEFMGTFISTLIIFLVMTYLLHTSTMRLMAEYFSVDRMTINRVLPIVITLFFAALIGSFSLVPAEGRADLRLVDAYLIEGAGVKTPSSLPPALRSVPGYISHAKNQYSLEPSSNIDLYTGEAPEGTLLRDKGIVIVRFVDGLKMTCLTIDESIEIVCEKSGDQ